jgi:hypothetical protein
MRQDQEKISAALAERGISMEELLNPTSIKKPDPTPGVGTSEPTPDSVTPAPIGSTANPTQGTQPATVPAPDKSAAPIAPPATGKSK